MNVQNTMVDVTTPVQISMAVILVLVIMAIHFIMIITVALVSTQIIYFMF